MASASNSGAVNINNLNIVTFIKDIYLSLKHLDTSFSKYKTDIDARINKLAEQHETILEKLGLLEITLSQIRDNQANADKMDKEIENQLLDKMYKLNSATEQETRLDLKPKELTIANILENGYTMLDIHHTLDSSDDSQLNNRLDINRGYKPLDLNDTSDNYMQIPSSRGEIKNENANEKKQTLDNILFG